MINYDKLSDNGKSALSAIAFFYKFWSDPKFVGFILSISKFKYLLETSPTVYKQIVAGIKTDESIQIMISNM